MKSQLQVFVSSFGAKSQKASALQSQQAMITTDSFFFPSHSAEVLSHLHHLLCISRSLLKESASLLH